MVKFDEISSSFFQFHIGSQIDSDTIVLKTKTNCRAFATDFTLNIRDMRESNIFGPRWEQFFIDRFYMFWHLVLKEFRITRSNEIKGIFKTQHIPEKFFPIPETRFEQPLPSTNVEYLAWNVRVIRKKSI